MSRYLLTWAGWDVPRWEQAHVEVGLGRLHARGTVLAGGDDPYRADYELDTTAGLVTRRLLVRVAGPGWSRRLLLTRDPDGEWVTRRTAEGTDPCGGSGADRAETDGTDAGPVGGDAAAPAGDGDLGEALDCDLAGSPLTSTMPVLRHLLHRRDGRQELVVARVSLPGLAVTATRQTHEHVRADGDGGAVRLTCGDLAAEVGFDAAGFVTTYPGVGRRV
jgi:uncharacterized protein